MKLEERVKQLEEKVKKLKPNVNFPSTATLEQRVRWLEILTRELAGEKRPELLDEEKWIENLLTHTTYIKSDRITVHSLTADPASVSVGDIWFRSDLGKLKLALDTVVANAKILADVPIVTDELADGCLTADATGRAKMADGFIVDAKVTDVAYNKLLGALYSLWGDGSDGTITESANVTRSGVLFPTTYDDGGYTITVDDKCLAIIAKESITISGTINASGQGGAGGAGGAGGSSTDEHGGSGSIGAAGELTGATGTGGNGGTGSAGGDGGIGAGGGGGGCSLADLGKSGGAGGDAKAPDNPKHAHFYPNSSYENLMDLLKFCGSGGSGGGGGGSAGSVNDDGGNGGTGGAGGGCVILCAPEISISGTIDVSGTAGSAGGNGSGDAGGGGGGAGGNGGVILIITANLIESAPTYNVSGGAGGAGGDSGSSGYPGGAGGNGADGLVIKLVKS